MRRALIALALACAALAAPPAHAQEELTDGWWVILGAMPNPDSSPVNDGTIKQLSRSVRRCGVAAFNDTSTKFQGFAPGYDVVVVGPYLEEATGQRYLSNIRRCAPQAYLKRGHYLGE